MKNINRYFEQAFEQVLDVIIEHSRPVGVAILIFVALSMTFAIQHAQ